jgi:hypothetical protein
MSVPDRRSVRVSPRLRAAALGFALVTSIPRVVAGAEIVCDAGSLCPDDDHDGFAACGCPWSGMPCDCDDTDPARFPGAPERCDTTRDDNCSGVVADTCAAKEGCLGSACVPECIPLDDFGCAAGSSFARQLDSGRCLCAPEDCTVFGCPPGSTCDDAKTCVPNCPPGVRCPAGQLCRGFGCVDPCAEVRCPSGAVCERGRCLPSCACAPAARCAPGEVCDLGAPVPTCVDPACAGVRCPGGSHCERGPCVDDCDGVVCPPKRVCRKESAGGARCADLCSPDPCRPGFVCDWRTGGCNPLPTPEGGLTAPAESTETFDVAGAGWLCASSGVARLSVLTAITGLGTLALLAARRRRRSR